MRVLERWDLPLVEDNPYGEVRFEGAHLPAMQALAPKVTVLSLGTLSKVLCPGLRIGWIGAPRPCVERLTILKQGADLHTSTLDQLLVAAYLAEADTEGAIARISEVYRERRDAMIAALEREMPAGVSWTRPAGGLFLWLKLPVEVDGHELLREALREDVAFVPGAAFFPNGGHANHARLNFSNMPVPRIEEGIRRLGRAIGRLSPRRVPAAAIG